MTTPAERPKSELRLALGMRGGVSLAVWIGGACAEIDELRRANAEGASGFWADQLAKSEYNRVVVDVMAGASAGGLNAVLFATAIRHGFHMGDLLSIWSEVGGINELRRLEEPWLSVLNGDVRFLDVIRIKLGELVGPVTQQKLDQIIDVQLSTTLIEPISRPIPSPTDESLRETRHSARFHFRYDEATHPIDHFDGSGPSLDRLAIAARATASFPVAFEPAVVRSSRPVTVDEPPSGEGGRLVDCRGFFSEARGPARVSKDVHSQDFIAADGGMVDNIPLGKAIDAIIRARSDRRTKRVLVYLHPTGPAQAPAGQGPGAADDSRRTVMDVARGALAARFTSESIGDDIAQLELHNRRLKQVEAMRFGFRAEVTRSGVEAAANAAWVTYRAERASVDANEITALLDDPIGLLGEDPFPLPPTDNDDTWYSPLAAWPQESRQSIDVVLSDHLGDALPPQFSDDVLRTGIDPLLRACRHLIEWTRELEDAADSLEFGDLKGQLYRLEYYLGTLKRGLWIALVVALADRGAPEPDDVRTFVGEVMTEVEWSSPDAVSVMGTLAAPSGLVAQTATKPALEELVAVLVRLRAARAARGIDLRDVSLLDRVLSDPVDAPVALAALEVFCFPEQVLGSPGGGTPIEFRRMSAASGTPLAEAFAQLRAESIPLIPPDLPPYAAARYLAPNTKLAGNELMSFSAFFDERWRENDWLWGRLDAVPTLVDVLLPDVPDRWAVVELRQRQIIEEHFAGRACPRGELDAKSCGCAQGNPCTLDQKMAAYRVGLETLQRPGSDDIVDSADALIGTAARVAKANAPKFGLAITIGARIARFVVRRILRPRGW